MELDEEHWKIVGYCNIGDYLKTILRKQDYDRSRTDSGTPEDAARQGSDNVRWPEPIHSIQGRGG